MGILNRVKGPTPQEVDAALARQRAEAEERKAAELAAKKALRDARYAARKAKVKSRR